MAKAKSPNAVRDAPHRSISLAALWMPVLLLVAAQPALPQPPPAPANWDHVKQLAPGAEIRVELKDRGSVRGKFESVTADSLVIDSRRGPETLTRQTIARVSSRRGSHRMRNALIGFGIGAGAGLGVGAIVDGSACHTCLVNLPNIGKEVFTPLGAIAGGIVGFLIPSGGWQDLYRAP
jgi:hypothetical protein